MKEVEFINVIRTTLQCRGAGIESDPIRRVTQYWSLSGELLAENDTCGKTPTKYTEDVFVVTPNRDKLMCKIKDSKSGGLIWHGPVGPESDSAVAYLRAEGRSLDIKCDYE
jgi:hypothetical protein